MRTPKKLPKTPAPNHVSDLLMNYATISFIVVIFCLVWAFSNDNCGYKQFVIDKYSATKNLSYEELSIMDSKAKQDLQQKYLDIYNDRKIHYEKSTSALSSIVNGLGVCCLISLLALYYDRRETISIVGIDVPFKSVFLILPVLMIYLWLSFGYTYFSALDSRQICYVAAVKYESLSDRIEKERNILKPDNKLRIARDFRMIHNLEDMGIIDGSVHVFNGFYSDEVFAFFYNNDELKPLPVNTYSVSYPHVPHICDKRLYIPYGKPDTIVVISLFAIFGTLLGLSVGFIMSLLIRFKYLPDTKTTYAGWLLRGVFALLCLSFIGFYLYRPYMLAFFGYIWLVAGVLLAIYTARINKELENDSGEIANEKD